MKAKHSRDIILSQSIGNDFESLNPTVIYNIGGSNFN